MYSFSLEFLLGKCVVSFLLLIHTLGFASHTRVMTLWPSVTCLHYIKLSLQSCWCPVLGNGCSSHGHILSFSLHPPWTSFLRPLFSVFLFISYEDHSVFNLICVSLERIHLLHICWGKCRTGLFFSSFFIIFIAISSNLSLTLPSLLVAKEYWYSTFCTLLPACVLVGFLSYRTENYSAHYGGHCALGTGPGI